MRWHISPEHFVERFGLTLGESIVVIGSTLSGRHPIGGAAIAAFGTAFAGSIALWWIYFDRSASEAARLIAATDDPVRLGTEAYHWIHPVMIAGIIVAAAADERVLEHPNVVGETSTAWMVLGGAMLFLAGHAAFKAIVWRVVPWTRLGAVAVLAVLIVAASHITALALAIIAVLVLWAVALTDRLQHRSA